MSAPAPRDNVFVVGCQRSGTSAVWAGLTRHPELEPTHPYDPETGFDPKELYYFRNIFAARKQFASPMYGWDVDREYLRRLIRMTSEFCSEFHGSRSGRWVSAHPADGVHIPEILETMPESRVVCVLRHPQEVVWSALRAPWVDEAERSARASVQRSAIHWRNHARMAARVQRGEFGEAVLLVRHEELTEAPEATADRLASHVGLDPHEAMRAQLAAPTFNSSNRNGADPRAVVADARARIGADAAFCETVEAEVRDEMEALGYRSLAAGDGRGRVLGRLRRIVAGQPGR